MSKQQYKKFRKNDSSYEDEDYIENPRNRVNKHKERRVERALRTKDISSLIEDEDEDENDFYSQEDYKNSMRGH
jgi:hypothetical protein